MVLAFRYVRGLVTLALFASAGSVWADAALARAKSCMSCHAMERKLVGPSYKAIAAKYVNDSSASGKLSVKVRQGGVGVWGQVPMPANPQLTELEASTLVRWILEQK
jgi:cytochrome c